MSFSISYVSGGVIDKIRELPYPHFSKFTVPYVKGAALGISATPQKFVSNVTLPFDTEFLSIAVACNIYADADYWNLKVGTELLCDTIYTKQVPESVSMGNSFGIVYPIPASTQITFEFYNNSGTQKTVWFNIKFLR